MWGTGSKRPTPEGGVGESATAKADRPEKGAAPGPVRAAVGAAWRWLKSPFVLLYRYGFSSLSRRIVMLNMFALVLLMSGVLYMNQFREGLTDARVRSLVTQGEIIAAAIAASATVSTDTITIDPEELTELEAGESLAPSRDNIDALEFPINPERVAPILRRLILPTGTRARIYDRDGVLIIDSRHLYSRGQILRYDLPPLDAEEPGWLTRIYQQFKLWLRQGDLPLYAELGPENGKGYPEVVAALSGSQGTSVRVNDKGEIIVGVAVPVKRSRAILGVLLLSTQGGDIEAVLQAEREGVAWVFLVAAGVSVLLSILLASTIAGPVRRLAGAAQRVRRSIKARAEIPDFTQRRDEIGYLSGSLRDMTQALYARIEAIESFAADVAHELKNPLTSLKSAVETLPLVRSAEDRMRLIEIVQHDVRRLDRLISDISDASRLDAELAREDAEPVDVAELLSTVISIVNDTRGPDQARVDLLIQPGRKGERAYMVPGHASRLGQVISNLIDNAVSFSPPGSRVEVSARRAGSEIEIRVDDEGRGLSEENLERIFERFYTDRPDTEAFGNNSGLGLSISRQIVLSHGGRIWAENRRSPEGKIVGARFCVRLPAGK